MEHFIDYQEGILAAGPTVVLTGLLGLMYVRAVLRWKPGKPHERPQGYYLTVTEELDRVGKHLGYDTDEQSHDTYKLADRAFRCLQEEIAGMGTGYHDYD